MKHRHLLTALLLSGCAATPKPQAMVSPLPTASVVPFAQTDAVASLQDAADDPAIWHNAADPAASLIVATDKKAGLNVYGLDGKLRSNLAAGRVNNVDLRETPAGVIVAASDRNTIGDSRLALFRLDTRTATLTPLARVPVATAEAYGLCMYQAKNGLYAFVVGKDGAIIQLRIAADGSGAETVRTMKLATQSEGCVADDRTGTLFVGEEDVGVWRFGAEPGDPVTPTSVAKANGKELIADVEGVAIAAEGADGGYLVVSSQGDSAYALWRLPDLGYAGRFRIAEGSGIGGTSETDGIEVSSASFGPGLEGGLMVVQDGDNAPQAQNFKLVRWAEVKTALGLE
ncbi:phytase [Sphingomonas cannabina]|uniref:phytase n=1 Tax=Sphingomonas cannabina TaxID=2899123 RepID=UPI001F445CF5|nr:phytase [Sphingomonas cannabina]UIJ45958.1 phytase [Sphingomonas cannabina]